jgi:hypothetical protein
MASTESPGEVNNMMHTKKVAKKEDLINGISDGLKDFIEGRSKHLKDDEELEAYMMGL